MLPLDALRGLAALGVALFFHYRHFTDARPVAGTLLRPLYLHGDGLVDLFFILSGFVFAAVYGARLASRAVTLRNFFVLRLSRLYPLHLAALLAVTALFILRWYWQLGPFVYGGTARDFLVQVLLLQNGLFDLSYSFNGPAWSIACEMTAYLLFALLCRFAFRWRVPLAAATIVGALFLATTNWLPTEGSFVRLLLGFFGGMLLGELDARLVTLRARLGYCIASLAAFVLAHRYCPFLAERGLILFGYPVIILAGLRVAPLARLLSLRPLTWLGDISYSVYLLHFPLQLLIRTVDQRWDLPLNYASGLVWGAYAALLLALATLSYRAGELPVQRRLRARFLR